MVGSRENESLGVCQAAHQLSTSKYTSPIFQRKEAYLSNSVPAHEEIRAVWRFADSHSRLWNSMVNKLVFLVSGDTIRFQIRRTSRDSTMITPFSTLLSLPLSSGVQRSSAY